MGLMDKMKDAAAQAVAQTQQGLEKAKSDFTGSRADDQAVASETGVAAQAPAGPQPIMELTSHIDGKNATVRLWPDRLEWSKPRGVSGGKLTAGIMTGGASLLVTGVKGGKDVNDMILLKHVTNVSSRKDGLMYYLVEVQTSSGAAVSFRVSRDEAERFRATILEAMRGAESRENAPVVIQQSAPAAAAPAAPQAADPAAQLQQLAGLHAAGILTDDEFAAKKAEILSRI